MTQEEVKKVNDDFIGLLNELSCDQLEAIAACGREYVRMLLRRPPYNGGDNVYQQ